MRLESARIQNFKRFVDLTIHNLPSDAKLIVLLGPNGCGKSSLFDAFQRYLKVDQFYGMNPELKRYYSRGIPDVAQNEEVQLEFHNVSLVSEDDRKKSLYVRSAYRHDPSFQNTRISQPQDVLDRHAVRRLIDTDRIVENNYQRIIWELLSKVTTPGLTTDKIMEDTVGDLRQSMKTVFGDLHLEALISAQNIGTFTFTKGLSKNFLYENLSAGEKAVFDLLLDVIVNKVAFNDSLYCIDEPEAHLSTKLQGKLLNELYRLIPENCQLWLATHSIGLVKTAQKMRVQNPDHVVFLDMGFDPDGEPLNYDCSQTIEPACPDHTFWTRHYAVALDDMAKLLAPDRIVLCEGSTEGDDSAFDESCYNKIFAREFPQTRFISVGSATNVERRMSDLLPVLEQIVSGTSIVRFRDRDDLTPDEIQRKRTEGVRVLSEYRNIESMLLSDGVLLRLCESHNKSDCFKAIQTARDDAIARMGDDYKDAAQAVHLAARTQLNLLRSGETKQAFMRDVLAPLVTAGTLEYESLKDAIFG
ncbi:MAG: Chromosome partition protein Smc [Verrucomicrobia subdivision 3 bacterium]|nr:Chromosome partition protein Smc [Limisphaerales bacterium]